MRKKRRKKEIEKTKEEGIRNKHKEQKGKERKERKENTMLGSHNKAQTGSIIEN